MTAFLSPEFNDTQFDNNGNLLVGGLIYSYVANSSTPLATYTTSAGTVAQANPIVLNARGEVSNPIWFAASRTYKLRLFDSSNNFIREFDNLSGIGDTSITIDQWVASGVTPTYVSATQFTLPGDQTSNFTVNRRVKCTVTAGTVYGYITVSAYTTLTTVTVVLDSGVLDSGLSAVQLGLLTPNNPSIPQNIYPPFIDSTAIIKGSADATKLLAFEADTNIPTATTVTVTPQSQSGTMGLVQNQILPITASVGSNALTITLNPTSLAFRSATIGSGTVNVRAINTAISVVVSSGSTLGTVNAVQSRLAVLAIDNAGTVELAVVNQAGGNDLTETGVITTTAEGGAGAADSANVIYSTTARTGVAYRVVGYIESTQATAGTWATAPSTIQGAGGQAITSMSSLGYGQTWQSVTRTYGTTYYNTTGRPIQLSASITGGAGGADFAKVTINGVAVNGQYGNAASYPNLLLTAIIPPNASYVLSSNLGTGSTASAAELR